jgi:hypothetical protein
VQYRNSLFDTNWTDAVPDVTATGEVAVATNALSGSLQRFYRVYMLK